MRKPERAAGARSGVSSSSVWIVAAALGLAPATLYAGAEAGAAGPSPTSDAADPGSSAAADLPPLPTEAAASASTALHAELPLRAAARVWAQGQETWTLLPRKLTNRDLRAQLEAETYRPGGELPLLALAADASAGAQLARERTDLTRFHGFFVLDAYAELELLQGLALNFNLVALNPSASDGYRFSSQLLPGFAVHLSRDLFELAGEPLHLEFVAPDLDIVTLGRGLLLEATPLEGYAVGVDWNGWQVTSFLGGRVFWGDDDFVAVSASALSGLVGVTYSRWITEALPSPLAYPGAAPSLGGPEPAPFRPGVYADYLTAHAGTSVTEHLRLEGEYGVRLRTLPRHALLVRADFLDLDVRGLAVHLGYQFRYYGEGFGPRGRLRTTSTAPNLPYREDAYVTNSIEYLGLSASFDQWSHTVTAEVDAPVSRHVLLFGWGELWRRYLDGGERVVYVQRFGRAPGASTETYFRAGLRLLPWPELPHRLSAYLTNKLVSSQLDADDPDPRRFVHPTVLGLDVEVFL